MTPEQLCACGCGAPAWRWRLSERCARLLAGACLGKTRFIQEDTALGRRTRGQDTYRCPVCDHWHNGGRGGNSPSTQRYRAEVIAGLRRYGYPLGQLAAGFAGMDRMKWKHRGEVRS